MDIEILKEFVFLSKGLNVTKASRELNMAQSTLSSHIIKLERDLGCSLVERDGSPRLTLAGREFLEVPPRSCASTTVSRRGAWCKGVGKMP